jgi:hypothetical protein
MSSNRPLGRMLVSKAGNRTVDVDISKVSLGSFYTTKSGWLTQEVRSFLGKALDQSKGHLLDPFAGDGHLITAVKDDVVLKDKIVKATGFDIQGSTWPINDSLLEIPNPKRAVILTNPPYLANHSAKRKGVSSLVSKYFDRSTQKNLYMIALENALESADYVVAIIPETFLLSSFPKDRLELAVVIQHSLFGDTDAPALVACFGKEECADARIFTGDQSIGKLKQILSLRHSAAAKQKIVFNDPKGRIGLRAVDGSDGVSPIEFLAAADFDYPTSSVMYSSRLMTYLDIPELNDADIRKVIETANTALNRIRESSGDLVLAPFKGNDRNGKRRRRLDYALARKILNQATLVVEKKVANASD